jgi:CPA2 family monovalent cation:H+ antiporter-2
MLGVPLRRVVHRVQAARDERYASLRGYFHGAGDFADDDERLHVRLHSVTLAGGAKAIGRALTDLNLTELGAEVTAIRRGKMRLVVTPETVFESGDIVVLRGATESVARAEARLLKS